VMMPPHSGVPTAAEKKSEPELQMVPALPIIGSYLYSYSKMPPVNLQKVYEFRPAMRRKYGDFYKYGSPTLGVGLYKDIYTVTDPKEMVKVLNNEGNKPVGIVQNLWALVAWGDHQNFSITTSDTKDRGFFGNGDTWRRLRNFMQAGLFNPSSAKSFTWGIIEACDKASASAPLYQDQMSLYSARIGFDAFYSVTFGKQSGVASLEESLDENSQFADFAEGGLSQLVPLMQPKEAFRYRLGIKTDTYKKFVENLDNAYDIVLHQINDFRERRARNELSDSENISLLAKQMDRQERNMGTEDEVSLKEMTELQFLQLLVAVDTTSSVINWTLLHLAMNPDVQQKLRDEVISNLDAGSNITYDGITRKHAPYMHAVLRENHRLKSAVPANCIKQNGNSDVEIHGVKIPRGNAFIMDSQSAALDPEIVEDPNEFRPERWLPREVAARKGTDSEFLDHPLYAGPFSQGARKCPGSRVATYEIHAILAHLVRDWKFNIDDDSIDTMEDIKYNFALAIQPKMPKFKFVPATK